MSTAVSQTWYMTQRQLMVFDGSPPTRSSP